MGQIAYSIVGFIVALGILVAVHEYGHFWVARRLGVKVLRFSIGFGKPIWSKHAGRDATEYVIGAIPLGGYVKMLDESEGEVAKHEVHRAFNRQHLATRAAIVLAGPLFNFLFAVVAYWAVFVIGVDGIRPLVGAVAEGSIAERSGLRVGDEITAIDGRPNRSWDEHRLYLFDKAFQKAKIPVVVRDPQGRNRTLEIDLGELSTAQIDMALLENGLGMRGYQPQIPAVAGRVVPDSPGSRGGLIPGDRIVTLEKHAIESWMELVTEIQSRPGKPVELGVIRDDNEITLIVTPEPYNVDGQTIGRIGVEREAVVIPEALRVTISHGPIESAWRGIESTWTMSALTVRMLIKMLQLEVSTKNLSGPITIAQYAGHTVQIGIDRFLLFLAIISISLGILNLLPIPVLDGGHLLYYVVEAITGGPLPKAVLLWGQQIGIALLLGLMTLAFYNDIVRLLQ